MGSLCNFPALKHPHSFKHLTIYNNNALLTFRSPPSANARHTRTRTHIPCLVVAQKNNNNNGGNPERKQQGGKKNLFNFWSNGSWPKQETVAQNESDNKDQKSSAIGDYFSGVLQKWEPYASKFLGVLLKITSIITTILKTIAASKVFGVLLKITRFISTILDAIFSGTGDRFLGWNSFIYYLLIRLPILCCRDVFFLLIEYGPKFYILYAIIGYSYVYLT